jgi:hypothetical protein
MSDADCYRLSSFVQDLSGLHIEQVADDLKRPLGATEVVRGQGVHAPPSPLTVPRSASVSTASRSTP